MKNAERSTLAGACARFLRASFAALIVILPFGAGAQVLYIADVSQVEGNTGTSTFTFAVLLTSPAAVPVTFDIATADGTAQDGVPASEDSDYVPKSLPGQVIFPGSVGPYLFSVTVNGDSVPELNETFFVNVTNVNGALAGDTQAEGTIVNDDQPTAIHDIQGNGATSFLVGNIVAVRGVVTGRKSDGFFIQEPDATVDADPATSEGIFVYTASAPPGTAAVGNSVHVLGTVAEFIPASDPLQPSRTQIESVTSVAVLSAGNPLPAAVPLSPTFPDPAGAFDQLERLEGMRVSVASMTVVQPTGGTVNEVNATATSNGTFYGVVTGVGRPFREPGIASPDPAPAGSIPPIPRFDSNPERIRVESGALPGGPTLDVGTGAVVTGLAGPLDYASRSYTILPDPDAALGVSGGPLATAVSQPTSSEFTVAVYHLERFYDAVNDPLLAEPVLTAGAYSNRLRKASAAIRNNLRAPDIVGVLEIENALALQHLAERISLDAVGAGQPDPQYMALLIPGDEPTGLDIGFLIKSAAVPGGAPRVELLSLVSELSGTLFVNPDSSTERLFDYPPLQLRATVNLPGAQYRATVILTNHLGTTGIADSSAGSSGWPTAGHRIRAKRKSQAEEVANLVQFRQAMDPDERIIVLGDFNASQFNDGLVDVMGTVAGTPTPDNETAVSGDGIDLVNPNLTNLFDSLPASERYDRVIDGSAQLGAHVLLNQRAKNALATQRIEFARINADFQEFARNDATSSIRLSNRDPIVGFFEIPRAYTPAITNATTNEDVATTTGLVVTPNPDDGGLASHYKITEISNGDLYKDGGTTQVATNSFVTRADAIAGFTFTPSANYFGNATFKIQASTDGTDAGLRGDVVTATITVNAVADEPGVTNAETVTGLQTSSGLVLTPNAVDGAEVTHFKITNIASGTLYQNDGVTPITNGDFISKAAGGAGLKFTPAEGFFGAASFDVQSAIGDAGAGLSGVTTAIVTVNQPMPGFTIDGPPVLNRRTKLFEQTLTITNPYEVTMAGLRITIVNLPNNATLKNRTHDYLPIIEDVTPLEGNESRQIVITFSVKPRRLDGWVPDYRVENLSNSLPPLPGSVDGLYHGLVERSDVAKLTATSHVGLALNFTVTKSGSVTGSLKQGPTTRPFKGKLTVTATDLVTPQVRLTVPKTELELWLFIDDVNSTLNGGFGPVGADTPASVQGWRRVWSKTNPAAAYRGRHNAVLVNTGAGPEGYGYASITVTNNRGALKVAGRLADGSVLSGGTFVGPDGQVRVYKPLYKNRGSFMGVAAIGAGASAPLDNLVEGTFTWFKPAAPASSGDTVFRDGFGPVTVTAEGSYYVAPAPGELVLEALPSNAGVSNEIIEFSLGGLETEGKEFNQEVRIHAPGARSKTNIATAVAPNDNRVVFTSFSAATGLFSGKFTLPAVDGVVGARSVNFFGQISKSTTFGTSGLGFFLLPQIPVSPETVNTAPKLSGRVEL